MKKSLIGVASLAVTLSLLAVPLAPAFAAGISVGNAAIYRSTTDTYSNFTIIDTNNPVSGNGWLTSFSYYAANTNAFEFVLVNGANVVQWVSPKITPVTTGAQTYGIVVPVQAGWNLGVHFDSTGTIPFDWTGAPASYTPNNNGMPVVGQTLNQEGVSNRTYSWYASGSDATTCSTQTLTSGAGTQFAGLTTTDPGSASDISAFTSGVPGAAVETAPDGFPGAWTAGNDPSVSGAKWVSDTAASPTNSNGGAADAWRLFTHAFSLPAGAIITAPVLHFAADNSATAFLDHTSFGASSGFSSVTDAGFSPTSSSHELEFVVKNDGFDGATNPTGVIYKTEISYCVPNPTPVVDCPAAPSIAAAYLKGKGVKPSSSTYTNVISLVAQRMGPQTDFNGVHACQSGYATVVGNYVQTKI